MDAVLDAGVGDGRYPQVTRLDSTMLHGVCMLVDEVVSHRKPRRGAKRCSLSLFFMDFH